MSLEWTPSLVISPGPQCQTRLNRSLVYDIRMTSDMLNDIRYVRVSSSVRRTCDAGTLENNEDRQQQQKQQKQQQQQQQQSSSSLSSSRRRTSVQLPSNHLKPKSPHPSGRATTSSIVDIKLE
jgi:hypothetical protein